MPRGDRTGPRGEGQMTGRKLGYCAGYDYPGYSAGPGFYGGRGRAFRGGFGHGFGGGYGFQHRFGSPYRDDLSDVSEKTLLENEIRILKDRLSSLENSLEDQQSKLNED